MNFAYWATSISNFAAYSLVDWIARSNTSISGTLVDVDFPSTKFKAVKDNNELRDICRSTAWCKNNLVSLDTSELL